MDRRANLRNRPQALQANRRPAVCAGTTWSLALVAALIAPIPAAAAISVGAPVPAPATIGAGLATEVVVTSQITALPTDPALIAGGVNLLRMNGAQGTVLGVMHDDGANGDVTAGDGIYTLKVIFIEPMGGQIQLQVSAAARGLFQRIKSPLGVLAVANLDSVAPTLTISPADGSTVQSTSPAVQIGYTDVGSGVDTATFGIVIDGIDFTSQFSVGMLGAAGQPSLGGGQHIIVAGVKDKAGNVGQATSRFTVSSFQSLPTATPTEGTIPLTVTFISNAIYTAGAITRWQWDYQGDGIFDVDEIGPQNHTFTFFNVGIYKALLKVTNDRQETASAIVTITAKNQPPTATAKVTPSNGPLPLAVSLTGTGTSPNGFIVKYEWDFQGDGTFDFSSTTTGNTSFTYTDQGIYNAVFRVTDNLGQTATAVATSTAIRVGAPGSPTARITSPTAPVTANAPLTVNFNGTGTPTTGRTIVNYEWDFDGDGTYDASSPTSPAKTFTYSSPGTYTVAFRVTDSAGAASIDTIDIKINIAATLTVSTDTLRTANGDIVNVRTTIGGTTPVTVLLKNKGGQVVRTLVNNVSRTAGTYNDPWDGRNDAGAVVPEGVYYAILQYKVGTNTATVDLTNSTGNVLFVPNWHMSLSASGQNCDFTFFSCRVKPLNDDFLRADFTLSQAGEVNLDIRQINTTLQIVQLFDRRPFGRGLQYSAYWDGTDASGKVLQTPSNDGYLWGMTVFSLPTNAIFVESGPQLSNVTAEPNYFDPSTGDFVSPQNPTTKISYTLSKPATVSLQVFRAGTNTLLRTVSQLAQAGAGVVEWDGHAANGLFADTGDYHLALKAVDAAGNQSVVRYAVVRVYY